MSAISILTDSWNVRKDDTITNAEGDIFFSPP